MCCHKFPNLTLEKAGLMLSGMIGAGGLLAGLATGGAATGAATGAALKASAFFWKVIGSSRGC